MHSYLGYCIVQEKSAVGRHFRFTGTTPFRVFQRMLFTGEAYPYFGAGLREHKGSLGLLHRVIVNCATSSQCHLRRSVHVR